MNDDDTDTDAGGDFFVDFLKTAIALFFLVLIVVTIGAVVWGLVV